MVLVQRQSLLEDGGEEILCLDTIHMAGTFQTKSGILTRHLIYSVSFFVEKNSRNLKPPSFSSLGRRGPGTPRMNPEYTFLYFDGIWFP